MADFAPPAGGSSVRCAFDPVTGLLLGRIANPGGPISGLTVSVFVDGSPTAAGTAITAADGAWSVTPGGLSTGTHSFLAKVSIPAQGTTTGTVGSATPATLRSPLFAFGLLGAAA